MSILKHVLATGAYYVRSEVRDFDAWSQLMIDDCGPAIKPFLEVIMEWSRVMDARRSPDLGRKTNCWEFFECGRQKGGRHIKKLGVCPASVEASLDRIHGGRNGGRACWVVEGTVCGGTVAGNFSRKYPLCLSCDFFKVVREEEGSGFIFSNTLEKMLMC